MNSGRSASPSSGTTTPTSSRRPWIAGAARPPPNSAAADAGIGPSVEPAGADDDSRSATDDAIERARQTLREIAAARADEQARAEEARREQLNRWYEQDREAEQERDDGDAFGIDY